MQADTYFEELISSNKLSSNSSHLYFRYAQYVCTLKIAAPDSVSNKSTGINDVYKLSFANVAKLFSSVKHRTKARQFSPGENCDLMCKAIAKWIRKETPAAKSFYASVLLYFLGHLNEKKLLSIVCGSIEATMSLSNDIFIRSRQSSRGNYLICSEYYFLISLSFKCTQIVLC